MTVSYAMHVAPDRSSASVCSRVGCQVQVRIEHLAAAQHRAFLRLRFLDLDDHVAACKHGLGRGRDLRADALIIRIGEADPVGRARLHEDLVARFDQFAHCRRHEADAVFMDLDFLRYADTHVTLPAACLDGSGARR